MKQYYNPHFSPEEAEALRDDVTEAKITYLPSVPQGQGLGRCRPVLLVHIALPQTELGLKIALMRSKSLLHGSSGDAPHTLLPQRWSCVGVYLACRARPGIVDQASLLFGSFASFSGRWHHQLYRVCMHMWSGPHSLIIYSKD